MKNKKIQALFFLSKILNLIYQPLNLQNLSLCNLLSTDSLVCLTSVLPLPRIAPVKGLNLRVT